MCEAVEKYADKKMLDKQLEMVKNLMDSMKLTAEQAKASRLIQNTIDAGLIKAVDPETAPRYKKYIPYWA